MRIIWSFQAQAIGYLETMSVFDRFKLTGKRLFITGGSRGLGREMALAIADAGADVVLVGRDPLSLERTAEGIRALGRQAWTIAADVGKPAECEQACQSALDVTARSTSSSTTWVAGARTSPRNRCCSTNGAS